MNTYNQQYDFPIKISGIKADDIVIPSRYAVIRTDTNKPLGIISGKYQLVPHKLIIDSFRQALIRTKMDLEENISLSTNGAYLNARYNFPDISEEIATGDYVSMQISLENSYDTTTSIKFTLGALRLVCTNGLTFSEKYTSYSQRHTQEFLVNDMADEIISLGSYFNKKVIPQMRKMSQVNILQEISERTFSKYEDKETFPLWLIDEARTKYQQEKSTVWEYYNSFTYALRCTSGRIGVKTQIQYSKKAWHEAIRLMTLLD